MLLTRQDVPVLAPDAMPGDGVARGGYVLTNGDRPDVVLVATGSEVAVALEARPLLARDEIHARVVSMPSWELFDAQDEDYRESVIPPGIPAVAVEAGVTQGWSSWADVAVGLQRFGASAPGGTVMDQLGITPQCVAARARELLATSRSPQPRPGSR
jgi:transketolase